MSGRLHVAPSIDKGAFHCPRCHTYAKQRWSRASLAFLAGPQGAVITPKNHQKGYIGGPELNGFWFALCDHCGVPSVWFGDALVDPSITKAGPEPNGDLPDDIRRDFEEARSIATLSPRGAAALLRLCIQKLCDLLGQKGKRIDDAIKSLVANGMPEVVQQALDVVRVIGNNAVHPGAIDLRDDKDMAMKLFDLVNFIADDRISRPKAVQGMFSSLPQSIRDAITKRDGSPP